MALTWRIVAGPVAQTDDDVHNITTTDTVVAGERLVILAAYSVTNITGYFGSVTDPGGNTWAIDQEIGGDGTDDGNGANMLSAHVTTGFASGGTISTTIKDEGFPGCSPHWLVLALNTGDTREFVFDTGDGDWSGFTNAPTSPSIVSAANSIVLGFFAGGTFSAGWFTPGSGWTEIADTTSGTESNYSIAAQGRVATSSYSGNSAGGSSGFNQWGLLIASYAAVASGVELDAAPGAYAISGVAASLVGADWPPLDSPAGPPLTVTSNPQRLS